MTHDNESNPTPTVVVAIGDSGIRDAEEIYEKAKREGVEDRLLVIWINSRSEFPDHAVPGIKTFRLKKPDKQHISEDIAARPYVGDDRAIRDLMAAKRNRDVARYYIDTPENISSLERFLRTRIKHFLTDFTEDPSINGPDGANVILTVGAGGGTGSGATPLIAAMVDTITDELSAQGALNTVKFHQWAIVSVATVQNSVSSGPAPDVKSRYLANTAALLSELQAMANAGGANRDLAIPLVSTSEGANLRRDAYTVDENPFSGVYLMEYVQDSDTDEARYRKGVNRTAAAVAYRWMKQDVDGTAVENAEDDLERTFYEVRAVTFQAPTETINELSDRQAKLSRVTAGIESLKEKRAGLHEAIRQVKELQSRSAVESVDLDTTWGADLPTSIDPAHADGGTSTSVQRASETALKMASNLSSGQISSDLIADRVETVQVQVGDDFHEAVPSEQLLAVVTRQAVVDQLAAKSETHPFPDEIADFVDTHAGDLEEFNGALDTAAPPLVQFSEVIRPFIKQRLEQLKSELSGTTFLVDHTERKALKSRIDNVEQTLATLSQLASEFTRIQETLDSVRSELATEQERLDDELTDLAERLEDVDSSLEAARSQRETVKDDCRKLRERLVNPRMDRTLTLPVTNPDHIDLELFEDSPSLAKLWNEGAIDKSRVANTINNALRAEEGNAPLKDKLMVQSGARSPARGRPIVLGAEDTIDRLWLTAEGDDKVTIVADSEYELDSIQISQETDDELTILVEYGGIHFENFIHPIGMDAIRKGTHEVVGSELDLDDSMAYPELLGLPHSP